MSEKLCDREKYILIMRYGLCGNEEHTQNEIGEMLGISRSYVSRIEKKALEKLKSGFPDAELM
jgi:RNA polymerase sporulation-specific sigma factor